MIDRVDPDFKVWSEKILDRSELEEALRQAYNQGYAAGRIDEENSWWSEFDNDYNCYTSTIKD